MELLKDYRTVCIGPWNVNCSDQAQIFPDSAVEQSLVLLSRWQGSFRKENTWSRRELGTPSLIIRLDCVVHAGKLAVYEVEERPSGIGVSVILNPFFKKRLRQVLSTWPDFRVVISEKRAGTDDQIWMDALSWPRSTNSDAELVLIRAEPEEAEFHHFESQSISSLIAKGDKAYGETLGLWHRVVTVDELPWERGFVLKPTQGSKMRDVEIWHPHKWPGRTTRSRIETVLSRRVMFLQEMVYPMSTGNPKFEWMIYRVYFGYNIWTSLWECLGGTWNARTNLRIHGAPDAVIGPVVLR